MLGVIRHDTQNVYVNNRHIEGAVGHAASVSIQKEPISIAGFGFVGTSSSPNIDVKFDVERNIVTSDDPITGFFASYIDATYKYGPRNSPQKFFSIESGVLTSYNISVAVNELATTNFSIKGLGHAGTTEDFNVSPSTPSFDITVAKDRDLVLDVQGWTTNRIQSVDYNLSINYNQKRYLGKKNHDFLNEVVYPIELTCTFEMEVDDYEIGDIRSMLCNPKKQTLDFALYDCTDGQIRRFKVPNGELTDYSHNGSIGGPMTATISYISYINDVNSLATILSRSVIGTPDAPVTLAIGTMEINTTFEVGP